MRLKKTKYAQNENIILANPRQKKQNILHHNKNSSMDIIAKNSKEDSTSSIYFNKVLQKSIGKTGKDFPNFKENISSFQSSIQKILSNEESRQKAMNYVMNLRNKSRGKGYPSLFVIGNNYEKKEDEINNRNSEKKFLSKTINNKFFAQKQKKIDNSDNQNYHYRYKDNNYKRK